MHHSRTRLMLLAVAIGASACGSSSSHSIATSSPASTPSSAVSAAPTLNVTATTEDYTGKPAPAGALVMTMSNFMFKPSEPAGTGSKILIYIDNRDPERHDCEGGFGGLPGSDDCYQHGLLVLGPHKSLLGKTASVAPGHQALLTLDGIRPGVYKFYCWVAAHDLAGMTGRLTVS